MEYRFNPLQSSVEGKKVSGYVVRWGIPSQVSGVGLENFSKGSLKPGRGDVVCYFQHDKKRLLGNTRKGTLKLTEDDVGLLATLELPDTASDVRELIKRGDIGGFSAGFFCLNDEISQGKRTIKNAELNEVSLVDRPAHSGTQVLLRSKKQKHCLSDLDWMY